jgi:hypothetical protein
MLEVFRQGGITMDLIDDDVVVDDDDHDCLCHLNAPCSHCENCAECAEGEL